MLTSSSQSLPALKSRWRLGTSDPGHDIMGIPQSKAFVWFLFFQMMTESDYTSLGGCKNFQGIKTTECIICEQTGRVFHKASDFRVYQEGGQDQQQLTKSICLSCERHCLRNRRGHRSWFHKVLFCERPESRVYSNGRHAWAVHNVCLKVLVLWLFRRTKTKNDTRPMNPIPYAWRTCRLVAWVPFSSKW